MLAEILKWSAKLPEWQRDALRRLVVQGELTEDDLADHVELCKSRHGLTDHKAAEPLAESHLPLPNAANGIVTLTSLTHHGGVNALAPDQTIDFGPQLTIIYGANAAGKSGYTRILKRACRARGGEEILGNVVSGTAPDRPSATISYSLDGTPAEPFRWDDDLPPNDQLSRVSVFDRHCASVYVSKRTDVAFRPFGLDLFDKLSAACEAVKASLEKERLQLTSDQMALPEIPPDTDVAKALSRLTSLTNPDAIRALANLSETEKKTIEALRAKIVDLKAEDPGKAARSLEIKSKRIRALDERLASVAAGIAESAVTDLHRASVAAAASRRSAEEARRAAFDSQPLPNTGSRTWAALWSTAKAFSEAEAYPDRDFPVIHNGRCVLCQQPLEQDAQDRFQQFTKFLSSRLQQELQEAAAEYERRRGALNGLPIADESIEQAIDEVELAGDEQCGGAARQYLLDATSFRADLFAAIDEGGDLPKRPTEPDRSGLTQLIEQLDDRIQTLREGGMQEALDAAHSQLAELEARAMLAAHLDLVIDEIERKKRLAAYQLCLDETKTTGISRKSGDITKIAVTDRLSASFKQELKALKFQHVEVEMIAAGTARGALYHRLQLRRAPGVSVPEVVSEGEARCLSIASFFAELSTASDDSAILFDDPVSSLDHNWRSNVAARLVEEATRRQVVVFTHDIVFLVSLTTAAEKKGIQPAKQYLRRTSKQVGMLSAGLPWPAMTVKERVGHLNRLAQDTGKLFRGGEQEEYERAAAQLYGLLREAWERGIEEVLLAGVVQRYRNSVETSKARYLSDIGAPDLAALNDGMTKASKWLTGHDQAAAEGEPFPEPDELQADIKAFDDWQKGIHKRRN